MVMVDSDCDGYTSAALLLNYIYARFPSAINKFVYSFHSTKVHGIDLSAIPDYCTLIIAPDSSSNEYEKHELLDTHGFDVLVLDHHQSDRISEYACVVNNQLCNYPTKSLSGVGIVYKLCQYIDSLFGNNIVDNFLDIVALGLIGDMMDMRDFETHYLTKKGLSNIRNPFFKGMVQKNSYSIGETLSPIKIAFYVVPLVNAITRVGTMTEKKILFDSMLEWKANTLIESTKRGHKAGEQETVLEQALRVCTNVKNRQTKNQDNAVEMIKEQIQKENLLEHKVLVVKITDPSFDKGITGLIANKLMAEYQRPVALVIKGKHEGEEAWSGSARGHDKSELKDFRQFVKDSGLVYLAEGHQSAFGIGIYDKDINDFIAYCDRTLKDIDFSITYKVDYIYSQQSIKEKDIIEISSMKELWGQHVEESLIAIENIAITKDMITLMSRDKNPTLKIILPNGINLIKFKSSEEELDNLSSESGCVHMSLIGKPEVNKYFDKITPQIIITDYEIINRQKYYF